MKKTESAWWSFAVGAVLTANCIHTLLTVEDGYVWRGTYIPNWTSWLLLPVGIIIMIIAIRAILRGESKPVPYTDEDAAKAEAEMDALYLREHGELPEKSKPEKINIEK